MAKVQVTINGITGNVEAGTTVLNAAKEIGAGMAHLCFGNSLCSTCRFSCVSGAEALSAKSPTEKVSLNYHFCFDDSMRLGCQSVINGPGPIEISVPKFFKLIAPPNKKKT
jgi:ferredoxin